MKSKWQSREKQHHNKTVLLVPIMGLQVTHLLYQRIVMQKFMLPYGLTRDFNINIAGFRLYCEYMTNIPFKQMEVAVVVVVVFFFIVASVRCRTRVQRFCQQNNRWQNASVHSEESFNFWLQFKSEWRLLFSPFLRTRYWENDWTVNRKLDESGERK